jgi:hypothetical protein
VRQAAKLLAVPPPNCLSFVTNRNGKLLVVRGTTWIVRSELPQFTNFVQPTTATSEVLGHGAEKKGGC